MYEVNDDDLDGKPNLCEICKAVGSWLLRMLVALAFRRVAGGPCSPALLWAFPAAWHNIHTAPSAQQPHPSAFPINAEGSRSLLGSSKPCKPRRLVGHPPTNMQQWRKFADDLEKPAVSQSPASFKLQLTIHRVLDHGVNSFALAAGSVTDSSTVSAGRAPAGNVEVAGRD